MTLRHFENDIDKQTPQALSVDINTTVITEVVTITQTPSDGRLWLLKPAAQWGWEEVRDYVVHGIEERFGVFPRNFRTEHAIFKSFCTRWGGKAGPIVKFAFEVREGRWAGAPISVNRFCKGSDAFFSAEIAKHLA